jgi:hypothetical protein
MGYALLIVTAVLAICWMVWSLWSGDAIRPKVFFQGIGKVLGIVLGFCVLALGYLMFAGLPDPSEPNNRNVL